MISAALDPVELASAGTRCSPICAPTTKPTKAPTMPSTTPHWARTWESGRGWRAIAMVVMSVPLVHTSSTFLSTSVRRWIGHVGGAVRRQVLHDRGVQRLLLGDPGREVAGADHLHAVVVHGAVPQAAQLTTHRAVRAELLRGGEEDDVVQRHRVGLHPERDQPEGVHHVEGGDMELDVRVVREHQVGALEAAERGVALGELPLLGDDLHGQVATLVEFSPDDVSIAAAARPTTQPKRLGGVA